MTDLIAELQTGFVDRILAQPYWGDTTLEDPAWRAAFDAVPRHLFAPDTWYEWNGDGTWTTRHRADDEDAWARAVYAVDKPLITQVDPDTGKPSCSLSAPMLVAAMLGALDLKPGMRVFESGAGCGWTATLMSVITDRDAGGRRRWRYGVDSVEYDPLLAAQGAVNAGRALMRIGRPGWGPSIRSGDGEAGIGGRPSYDATTATHAVWRIPGAWIDQTRPGGLVCAPLAVSDNGLDVFVRLTVRGDGSASGRVKFPLAFMRSRTAPAPPPAGWAEDEAREDTTDLDLPAIITDEHAWVLQLAIPGITITGPTTEDGDDCVWLSLPDGSRAVAYVPQGKPWTDATVEQYGPQDVWTIAEDVWAHWQDAGRPEMDEFGLTVEADGTHRLWMGEPGNVVTVLP